jgi:hypothetical protein
MDHPERSEVLLELLPADEATGASDRDLPTTLQHELAADLQKEGFLLPPPASTDQKGAADCFITAWLLLQQVPGAVWQEHAAIAEGLADLSALVTVLEKFLPLLRRLRERHARLVGRQSGPGRSLGYTIELEGTRVTLEAADLAQAEAALQLANKLQTALASDRARSGK